MFEGHHRSRQGRPHRLARCCFHRRPDDYVCELLPKLVTLCITIRVSRTRCLLLAAIFQKFVAHVRARATCAGCAVVSRNA